MIPLLLILCGQWGIPPRPPAEQPQAVAFAPADYAAARRRAIADGVPLVVVVSADWCQPCQRLKRVLASWHDRRDVAYCEVDYQSRVGKALGVETLPTTFIWSDPTKPGKRVVGYRSAAQMEGAVGLNGILKSSRGNVAGVSVSVQGQFVGVRPNTMSAWRRHVAVDHGVRAAWRMNHQQLAQAHADAHAAWKPTRRRGGG